MPVRVGLCATRELDCRTWAGTFPPAQAAAHRPLTKPAMPARGVTPVQLLLCALQQFREFLQKTSVSKTAPRLCRSTRGTTHSWLQLPEFLPAIACCGMTRGSWLFSGREPPVSCRLGLESPRQSGRARTLGLAGANTKPQRFVWPSLVTPHTCMV